jgi:DNA-binding transcriptional LysR family regulator
VRQEQLDGLIAFVTVAEEHGFSAAAVRLGVSPSAVSQAIRGLEQRLGLTLFNRTTRSVGLTEVGSRYLERVRPCIRELEAAREVLVAETDRPTGTLRLNVARSGYMIVLQPILQQFLAAYPEVNLEIVIDSTLADIVGRGFDAGIRFGDLVEKDMVAVKIGPPISSHVIASPAYLARRGAPTHPHDLLEHECIAFRNGGSGQVKRWAFAKGDETFELSVKGRLIINDSAALVQAALDGVGISYMINGYIERFVEQGRLVRLLEDWSTPRDRLTLYYPDRHRAPLKLRALIDFLRQPRRSPNVEGTFIAA